MKTKKYKQVYPIILVNTKLGILRIVNRKSTTSFLLRDHETKKEMDEENKRNDVDEWTPEHEVEMATGNGFHRIHDTDNDRWDLWDTGKEISND